MDRTVKTTLAAVLPIALFLLAIPVVLTVVLFVSCERSERERAEEKARYTELLGGAPSAVVLSGDDVTLMDGSFSYTSLLLPAANAAREDGGAYEYIVWDSEHILVGEECLYLSAYAYSVTEEAVNDSYVFVIDLAEREAEAVYSAPRAESGGITLLSLSEGRLFWIEGNEAVLFDTSSGTEADRAVPAGGDLLPAGDGFAYYEVTEEEGDGRIVFLEGGAEGILSYSYDKTEQTGFVYEFTQVDRGVALLYPSGRFGGDCFGVYVRTGEQFDEAQTQLFLEYRPFAYGWQYRGQRSSEISKDGNDEILSDEWMAERSPLIAELSEMQWAQLGSAYALKTADGTPCICYEAGWQYGWGQYYYEDTLYFMWTEEDTLVYLGSVQYSVNGVLCLLSEEA